MTQLSSKSALCLKAATNLGPEDTARFVELFDAYSVAGLGQAPAAQKAASDLVAEIRSEGEALLKSVGALTTKPVEHPAGKALRAKSHPAAVRGSVPLAEISRALGGLSPSLLPDLSQKVNRTRTSKLGSKTQYVVWDNPPVPGVGPLFRVGGTGDLGEVARVLEEAGYLTQGTTEADGVAAGNRAADIIRAELARGGATLRVGDADAIEAEARRRADEAMGEPEQDPWDSFSFTPDDLDETGYSGASDEVRAAIEQLLQQAESAGVDTETIREDVARALGADATDEAYHDAIKQALQQAIDQRRIGPADTGTAQAGGGDRGQAAEQAGGARGEGRQGGSDQEGLTPARGASAVLARESINIPVTTTQQKSPYARYATGDYIVTVQQFGSRTAAIVYAVNTGAPSGGMVATYTEEIPSSTLESREFRPLGEAARKLFDRVERARESDLLTSQSVDDLKAKTEREAAARRADEAEQQRLERKDRADAQRDEFTLTGSDRAADVAAAAGQGDIFGGQPAEKEPDGPTPNYKAGDRITPDKDVIEGDVVTYDGKRWMARVKRGVTVPLAPIVNGKPVVNADSVIRVNLNDNEVTHTGMNVYGYGGQPMFAEQPAAPAQAAPLDAALAGAKRASAAPAWHTPIPTKGLAVQPGDEKPDSARSIMWRVAEDAAKAITPTQKLNGSPLYAYLLPSTETEHGVVRLLPDDQTAPAGWKLLFPEALRVGMMSPDHVAAKLREALGREPILASGPAPAAAGAKKKPAKPAAAPAAPARLTDAGEELIRNRRGKLKGLAWSDISGANDTLKVAQVVKSNVWPRPDYAKLVEDGMPAWKAATLKAVYDKLAAAPQTRTTPTDEDLRLYIETVHQARELLAAELDRVDSIPNASGRSWEALKSENVFRKMFPVSPDAKWVGNLAPSPFDRTEAGKLNNKRALLIGGNNAIQALQFNYKVTSKIKDLLADGFPAKQEAWEKSYHIKPRETRNDDVPEAERTGEPQTRFYVTEKGYTWRLAKGGQDGGYATQEAAEAFARSLTTRKKAVLPPSRGLGLDEVKRTGPDWRNGRDVTAQEVMERFGFRGLNLGEYVKARQDVAQLHLNHVFDAFSDLADLMGVPPKAMSLNGTLGVAIGAQGSGKALAHFAPGVNEINITRDSGAGALAHEFGHAMDHYFATQHGRAASMAKRPYLSAVVDRAGPGEVRTEVLQAMRTVMQAINSRPMTEAEARKYMADQKVLNEHRLDRWVKEFKGNRGAAPVMLDALAAKIKAGDLGQADEGGIEPVLSEFVKAAGLKPGNAIAANAFTVAYRLRSLADEATFMASHIPQVETDYSKASGALDAGKSGDGYWGTPWEKFARAFETFAMDALADRQRESLYLSGLVDSDGWAKWSESTGQSTPYPTGQERLVMQQAFQALADAIQTRQDDAGNVAMFSLGASKQTETPEFKRWFGGSKVVDDDGKPLVVYHGTRRKFTAFDTKAEPNGGFWPSGALGSFFSPKDWAAEIYGPNVMPVYLAIANPYRMTTSENGSITSRDKGQARRDELVAQGYDGIIIGESQEFVAFYPEQVKSATSNTGAFDPSNPDIRFGINARPANSARAAQAKARVQATTTKITEGWSNAPSVRVIGSMDEAPQEVRAAADERRDSGAAGSPEGFWHNGTVYLVAEQLPSDADVTRVLFHEALGHAGLRGVFGSSLDTVLDTFAQAMPVKVAAKAAEYGLDMRDLEQRRQAAEEALAEIAQTRPKLGSVQRLIAAVRTWLRENLPGLGIKMSDAEVLRNFIEPARGWVERGRAAAAGGPVRFMVAYHGTPHRFDKFTTDKMGTGEGQQVFGWGLYFAGKKEIAEHYRKALSDYELTLNGEKLDDPEELNAEYGPVTGALLDYAYNDGIGGAKAFVEHALQPTTNLKKYLATFGDDAVAGASREDLMNALAVLKEVKQEHTGQLYEVDIPEDGDMLLWDKPLSEQPAKVQEALRSFGFRTESPGQFFYTRLSDMEGGDKAASEALMAAGIKGIDYPAQSLIGGNKDGARNYVIFSGDDVAIKQTFFSLAIDKQKAVAAQKALDEAESIGPDEWAAAADASFEAQQAFADKLAAIPDDSFALSGERGGRMTMVNPSAQKPGQYQVTRFDTKGEPWSDAQHFTKRQAIDDFLQSVDLASVQDSGGAALGGARFSLGQSLADRVRNYGGGEKIVGETGRQYTQDQLAAMRHVGAAVQMPTLEERAKALWKDAGKKLAQGLVDQFAPVKELSGKAYSLLRLSKGASGAFETLLQGGKLKLSDGVYDFDESAKGGVVETLLKPLGGEHHDFFRWIAANRAERLMSEGKENLFTAQDIAALKTLSDGTTSFAYTIRNGANAGQVTRDRTLIYADALRTFNGFNKNVLDMAEQSGLIDGESRAIWEHDFYVPFYRVSNDEDGGIAGANVKSGMVRQQAFKELKGGANALNNDLLDNTLMNWAHLIDASAKNRAAVETLAAAERMGVAMSAPEDTARQMASSVGKKSNVVWAMDQGRKHFYVVDDPYVMTALTALEFSGMKGPAMKVMSAFKHALTVGVTASPFFKIRNLIRDSVQVIGTSNIDVNPLHNLSSGWKLTDPKSDAYFRLLAGGGTIHFGTMMEGSEAKRVQALVESGVDSGTILNSDQKLKAFYRKVIEPAITAYNELGNRGEAVNRAALYDQLIKQGKSHAEASLMARDLMDFSMQGSFTSVRFLTQIVPFFNARIQGLYKLGRAAKEDPARFSAVVGATTLASLGLLMAFGDDDDWKKREEWDRNNFWWFKIGGTAYRIPKPFEIGAVATLAERGFELAFDKEMTGRRFRQQVMTLLGDNLSMNPVPQLVKPMLDIYANVDSFSGRPIESMGMEKLKADYRFTGTTSMAARGISTAANAVTGLVDKETLSPLQVDHLLRGYFGWLGTFVIGAGDVLARPATGQADRPASDMWKAATGGMVSDLRDAPSRYVSQMYRQAQEIEEAHNTWKMLVKQGKVEEATDFAAENRPQLMKFQMIEHLKASTAKINQRIKAVEQGDESGDQKREQIRSLQEQRDRLARRLATI